MTTFGINLPSDGRIAPEWVRDHGATMARVVLTAHHDLNDWIAQAHACGVEVQGVIARESLDPPGVQAAPPPPKLSYPEYLERIRTATGVIAASAPLPSSAMSYEQAAAFYVSRYPSGTLASLQVGNEPDIESPSSWTMVPEDLSALLAAFDAAFGSTRIIGPGLASGQPSYWESVPGHEDLVDALACFVPDQVVTATRPTHASMRQYEGDVVTITTAAGNKVTCTPNHPILTRQGWLPAGQINEGAQIAQYTITHARMSSQGANDIQVPTPISDVFGTLNQTGKRCTRAGQPLDFHGDGRDSNVQVVTANGFLGDSFPKPRQQVSLMLSDVRTVPFTPQRHQTAPLFGMGPSQRCGECSVPVFDGSGNFLRSLESAALGFGPSDRRQAAACEEHMQATIANADIPRYGNHRLTGHMAGMKGLDVVVGEHAIGVRLARRVNVETMLLKDRTQAARSTPNRRRDSFESLAGQVAFVDVVEIDVRRFSGHVYNLTTQDGLIIADGIVTHNCHPYGRRPNDNEPYDWLPGNFGTVPELLEAYGVFGQDMVISEWGLSTTEVGPSEQAHYIDEMLRQFDRDSLSADVNILFAADDQMVPEFGLYWQSGQAKPSAGTYVATVNELHAESGGEPIMPDGDYTVGQGIRELMAQYGDTPGSDEAYYPVGAKESQWSECMAMSGTIYRYLFAANQTFRFPAS